MGFFNLHNLMYQLKKKANSYYRFFKLKQISDQIPLKKIIGSN